MAGVLSFLPRDPKTIFLAVAVAQWLLFALASMVWRTAPARARVKEWPLLASTFVFLGATLLAFNATSLVASPKATVAKAGMVATSGGCAAVSLGAKAAEIESLLGKPDSIRSEEDLRGPGATEWVYQREGCVVHMVDGVVEFNE